VFVYDLTPLCHPQVLKTFYKKHGQLNTYNLNYIPIKKPRDFLNLLIKICKSETFLAIDFLNNEISSNIIRAILKLKKIERLVLKCGELPSFPIKKKPLYKLLYTTFKKNPKNQLIKKFFHKICNKICKPNFYVCAGKKSFLNIKNNSAKIIKAHSFDYDNRIIKSKKLNIRFRKKIVFLDEDMCFHPDYSIVNEKPVVDQKKYFQQLKNLFLEFEKKFEQKIVIAEHPRARYSKKKKQLFFGKRDVVANQTENLVKNCSIILAHSSTSLSFAVLHKKPVVLLSNSELSKSRFGESILAFSNALDAPIVFMDKLGKKSLETLKPLVNKHKYDQYKNDYIRENHLTYKESLWEIISKYLFKRAI